MIEYPLQQTFSFTTKEIQESKVLPIKGREVGLKLFLDKDLDNVLIANASTNFDIKIFDFVVGKKGNKLAEFPI